MSDPFRNKPIPKAALIGAAALIVLSLAVTTAHVTLGFGSGIHGPGDIIEARALVFADGPAGEVLITDGETGQPVGAIGAREGSFVRSLVRLVALERQQHGGSAQAAFHLVLREGGHLSLIDPVTERQIGLNAFGQDNFNAFYAYLGTSNGDDNQ